VYSVGINSLWVPDRYQDMDKALAAAFPHASPVHIWHNCADSDQRKVSTRHCGENLDILTAAVESQKFKVFVEQVKENIKDYFVNHPYAHCSVGIACWQGRHRSVSWARLLSEILMRIGFDVRGPVHLSRGDWFQGMCTSCDACALDNRHKAAMFGTLALTW
jgi:hypothetical protein